jgi:multidrug efflux pump
LLTLLTTPVVYLLLDKLRRRGADERYLSHGDVASQRFNEAAA